uniref:Glia maturation factor gamma n=1 Tax=Ovis aries TaxID=9940 RepID=A0AC11D5U5_SHEEP
RPHTLQPTRLLRPWDFPGKSTGVGCHCLVRLSLLLLSIENRTERDDVYKALGTKQAVINGSHCSASSDLFISHTALEQRELSTSGALTEGSQNISPEELKMELPERQPRFVVYSYKYMHADGRVSYPLCFIFSSPVGCKPEQQMMYAGSKNRLVQTAELTKVFEIRTTDDLTEAWLKEKLSFFR